MTVVDPLLQRWAFGLALAFTSLGTAIIGVFPIDTPQPLPLDPALLKQLRQQGWKAQSSVPAQGITQVSNASGVVLIKPQSVSLEKAQLRLIPIRGRSGDQLGSENIGTAVFAKPPKEGRTLKFAEDQFFLFRHDKQQQLASSCIVSGQARSSDESFQGINNPPATLLNRIKTSLGVELLRDYSCLFITISVAEQDQAAGDRAIRRIWALVRPTLIK